MDSSSLKRNDFSYADAFILPLSQRNGLLGFSYGFARQCVPVRVQANLVRYEYVSYLIHLLHIVSGCSARSVRSRANAAVGKRLRQLSAWLPRIEDLRPQCQTRTTEMRRTMAFTLVCSEFKSRCTVRPNRARTQFATLGDRGLFSSAALTLLVLPVLYRWMEDKDRSTS